MSRIAAVLIIVLLVGAGGVVYFFADKPGAVVPSAQTPEMPFPYNVTEIMVENDGVSLAGTLTVPNGEGPFPAVILQSFAASVENRIAK